jgi:hypothetical protein
MGLACSMAKTLSLGYWGSKLVWVCCRCFCWSSGCDRLSPFQSHSFSLALSCALSLSLSLSFSLSRALSLARSLSLCSLSLLSLSFFFFSFLVSLSSELRCLRERESEPSRETHCSPSLAIGQLVGLHYFLMLKYQHTTRTRKHTHACTRMHTHHTAS